MLESKGVYAVKIHICSPTDGWIIQKFGQCVYRELKLLGEDVSISAQFAPEADINHYFIEEYCPQVVPNRTTFFVTHVDTVAKLERVRDVTNQGAIGVCMSKHTMNDMISSGVRRDRICYIHPAQDGMLKPKKITLGFTHKTHDDYRNRESMLIDVCKQIQPDAFRFIIMGSGWESIIDEIRCLGFEVEYYAAFDKVIYNELIPRLDYYCFFGFDEGSMGFLDAVAAGINTIVTPQGYHLDTECGITYPVQTIDDIVDVLHILEKKRNKYVRFAQEWTWKNYALKLLEIWKYMLRIEKRGILMKNRGRYVDGIFSLLLDYAYDDYIYRAIPAGSNIVLWGAGKRGKRNYDYIKEKQYCNIVLWIDSAYKDKQASGLQVSSVETLFLLDKKEYDYILVAIADKAVSREIERYLLEKAIPAEKIILTHKEMDI